MTPDELVAAGERLYGVHWRQPLCWALQVNVSTMRRWTSGTDEVPGPAQLAIRLLLERQAAWEGLRMSSATASA